MSENQKEAIKKSLERKLFYQNNPSAKEADERRKEVSIDIILVAIFFSSANYNLLK